MTRSIRWPLTILVTIVAALGVAGFTALGVWQVHRLNWKLSLIERVETRVNADPVAAPGPGAWEGLTSESAEYRRVSLSGEYLNADEVLIYTPSDYGPAFWVLTPLRRDDGTIVMVNRGLVPEARGRAGDFAREEGPVTVTGLLRLSEDEGWLFSRDNDPENGLWYRRDIGSITAARGYETAAPYFVDAELGDPAAWPRGGQTVVSFRNAHLSYALTWFTLALLVAFAWALFLRFELRRTAET